VKGRKGEKNKAVSAKGGQKGENLSKVYKGEVALFSCAKGEKF